MSKELPKTYDFKNTETAMYQWWWDQGYFKPINDPKSVDHDPDHKPYVISIPPPNVTGELHLGHAMFVSMEDLMIRYHRMKGIPTLWVPGTDHAGIATQMLVERALAKEGIRRQDLGREKFLERSGNGKTNIMTASLRRSSVWVPPVTGTANASRWTRDFPKPSAKPLCAFMRKV